MLKRLVSIFLSILITVSMLTVVPITVGAMSTLSLGEKITLSLDFEESVELSFTPPSSGYYLLESPDNYYLGCSLFDENGDRISRTYSDGENFRFTNYLEKGNTYTYKVLQDIGTKTFSLILTKDESSYYSYYLLDDGTISVSGYEGDSKHLEIPSYIDGYKVTYIDECAFQDYDIESVVIPSSVEAIRAFAFENCANLKSINISDTVTEIYDSVFDGCVSLESIVIDKNNKVYDSRDNCNAIIETKTNKLLYACKNTVIPDTVVSFAGGAFSACKDLKEIYIPSGIKKIESGALYSLKNLEKINVSPDNKYYDSRDNCNAIIEKSTNTLIQGCRNTVIPNTVVNIAMDAMSGLTSIKKLHIPNSVENIESCAFYGCSNLSEITGGNGLLSCFYDAFYETKWLNSQPDGPIYIGSLLYQYKGKLPANNSVTIKEGTLGLADYALGFECANLEKIQFPSSLVSIGFGTLEQTKWYNNQPNGAVYVNDILYSYKSDNWDIPASTVIKIKEGTKYINESAFNKDIKQSEISIPSSVERIGEFAFAGFMNLKEITILNPDCKIVDSQWGPTFDKSVTIRGYNDSTAQAYANKNGNKFVSLGDAPKKGELTDSKTNITVVTNDDVKLSVQVITDSAKIDKINTVLTNDILKSYFNITLTKDGKEVQPSEKVVVKIPASNSKSKVLRVEKDGSLTDMNAVYKNGFMEFTTEHFSEYILTIPKLDFVEGDVDGDNRLSVMDATAIQLHMAQIKMIPDEIVMNGDTDDDGKLSVMDATQIQLFLAKIIPEL